MANKQRRCSPTNNNTTPNQRQPATSKQAGKINTVQLVMRRVVMACPLLTALKKRGHVSTQEFLSFCDEELRKIRFEDTHMLDLSRPLKAELSLRHRDVLRGCVQYSATFGPKWLEFVKESEQEACYYLSPNGSKLWEATAIGTHDPAEPAMLLCPVPGRARLFGELQKMPEVTLHGVTLEGGEALIELPAALLNSTGNDTVAAVRVLMASLRPPPNPEHGMIVFAEKFAKSLLAKVPAWKSREVSAEQLQSCIEPWLEPHVVSGAKSDAVPEAPSAAAEEEQEEVEGRVPRHSVKTNTQVVALARPHDEQQSEQHTSNPVLNPSGDAQTEASPSKNWEDRGVFVSRKPKRPSGH